MKNELIAGQFSARPIHVKESFKSFDQPATISLIVSRILRNSLIAGKKFQRKSFVHPWPDLCLSDCALGPT
jgi:hypothetical protein